MPRKSKGARLYLRRGAGTDGLWVILDGPKEIATGIREGDRERAEKALADHILTRTTPLQRIMSRDASRVMIAEVIEKYAREVIAGHARPQETASRLASLLDYWGDKSCDEINIAACQDYAKDKTPSAARRQLEDLRSALRHAHADGLLRTTPRVTLPPKPEPRQRWLTRDEAAKLLWTCWRAKERQMGKETFKYTHRHTAKFILVGLYTGTRAGAICGATWDRVDFEQGLFYRLAEGQRLTKKRQPPVPLPDRLLAHLRRWKTAAEREQELRRQQGENDLGGVYVIEWNRQPVARVNKSFRTAAQRAGLEGVHPHVLRHTAATWLMRAGVSIWQAAGYLGMSEEMVERNYGHHHPAHLNEARQGITSRPKKSPRNPKKPGI